MSKIILTDADETILSFVDPFQEWLIGEGYSLNGSLRDTYGINHLIGVEDCTEIVSRFHETAEAFGLLEPEPYAVEALTELYLDGYRFVAITAVDDKPVIRNRRIENLNRAFGFEFEDCICVGQMQPKTEALKKFDPTVWVEDNPHHAHEGSRLGHRTFLVSHNFNAAYSDDLVTRVQDWREIRKAIR